MPDTYAHLGLLIAVSMILAGIAGVAHDAIRDVIRRHRHQRTTVLTRRVEQHLAAGHKTWESLR